MTHKRKSAAAKRRQDNLAQPDQSLSSSSSSTQQQQQEQQPVLLAADKTGKKWRNMAIRTFTTLLMIGAFFFVLASGYVWSIVAVMGITIVVYREVIQIAQVPAKEKSVRWFKTMSW